MQCTKPLIAYQSPSGKVFFTPYRDHVPIQLPCNQCIACRLNRSREWATRCLHESKLYDFNCFLTLTYSEENLPPDGSLRKEDLTKFFKRLRKKFPETKIRYFACGEYGERLNRPHYHVILFNHDFHDKVLFRAGEFPLYISPALQELWSFGHSVVAAFSFETAAYTARYVTKKINGAAAEEHYSGLTPEFCVQSRRPGIGFDFFMQNYEDFTNYGTVVSRGGLAVKPPRYYEKLHSGCDLEQLQRHKESRKAKVVPVDAWRLQDLDKVQLVKFDNMMRNYENG